VLQNVVSILNVQHNCHVGECLITQRKAVRVEQQDADGFTGQVEHADQDNYVAIPFDELPNQNQVTALHKGLAKWHAAGSKTGPPGPVQAIDPRLG
ncbi:hypothetical protein PSHT_09791, partial [Puccinia striiformis]